ncbi:phage tail assembly protein [Bosea massiliensis]|uniref:Phage tail assembly protein n=1 Tax=Bosea massiliensis TaxID=151419 RepID=A0ABW0PBH5_9HYPH
MSNENDKPAARVAPAANVTLLGARTREITLEYPAEWEGKTYDKVTVRRMTPVEVGEFVAAAAAGSDLPMAMLDIPEELFRALDNDDQEQIEEAIFDFLPRRLQTVLLLDQGSGVDTSPPSQASSEAASSSTSA